METSLQSAPPDATDQAVKNPLQWIGELQNNSRLLQERLEAEDWAGLQQAVARREQLLQQGALQWPAVQLKSLECDELRSTTSVREALEKALNLNLDLAKNLEARKKELAQKIKDISKGRKTLNLYKSHRPVIPRFFDRFG
jgi:hypothetical protein